MEIIDIVLLRIGEMQQLSHRKRPGTRAIHTDLRHIERFKELNG